MIVPLFALALAAAAPPALAPPVAPAGVPTIPPAVIDDSLEVAGDPLAAEQTRTRMFILVRVDGQGPFRFLVDSGADRSVVGLALAAQLALPPGRPVTLQGMAGAARVATVRVDTLQLGASTIPGIAAPALPERYLGAQGIVGIDALADQRLLLDFAAKTVTVQDARRPASVGSDEIVVVARRRNGQLILTAASVGGVPVYAVIDTGSEVTMGNLALQARLFGSRPAAGPRPVVLTSVTGQTLTAGLATLSGVRLGGIDLANVTVAFADAPPFRLFGLAKVPALLIGADVLEAFRRVALDFRGRRVRFTLRR